MRFVVGVLLGFLGVFGCFCEEFQADYGTFSSDDYPATYPNNINKTWTITVSEGFVVRLFFTVFDVENSYEETQGSCVYDYLKINNKRFCGNMAQHQSDAPGVYQKFFSTSNQMVVRFVSDYSNESPLPYGFVAHFRAEDINECKMLLKAQEEDWDQVVRCNHFCHNVPGSYYCSCRRGFSLHANGHTCVADCPSSVIVVGSNGTLASPEYPNPYSKLSNCQYAIEAIPGHTIDVRFDSVFEIEDHYEEGCAYDWVKIILPDGNSDKYCGSTAPANGSWLQLHTSAIIVEFYSDLSVEKTGFKLYYSVSKRRCRQGSALANGNVQIPIDKEYFEYGDVLQYSCDVGYNMIGLEVRTCGDTGEWDHPPPTCQIKVCPRPDHLLNISKSIVVDKENLQLHYGSSFVINCFEWYEMVSGSSEWRCGDDQTWQPVTNSSIFYNDNLPSCQPVCGRKNRVDEIFAETQIIGGREARNYEWPWMAFLDLANQGLEAKTFCGGSLVHEQYVVTAAHCVPQGQRNFHVYLGVTNRSDSSNPHMQVFRAIEVTVHNGFLHPELDNLMDDDIAVIKLNSSAVIGRYVRPVCLPRTPREKQLPEMGAKKIKGYQERGVIAGWGKNELDEPSMWLMMTRVPFVNRTQCVVVFKQSTQNDARYSHVKLTTNMICAGFVSRSRDSCKGDSGGPLMFKDVSNSKWFLNGIVSFGTSIDCKPIHVLGIYTKVANYLSFLDTHIV